MSLQSLILDKPKSALKMLSIMPSSYWQKAGKKLAKSVANGAIDKVPAYRDFLKNNHYGGKEIATMEDFSQLPIMDKENYINCYDLEQKLGEPNLNHHYTVERSSGHGGNPLFWPRNYAIDKFFSQYIEIAFLQAYRIDVKSTLVILTFALGTWTSGEKTADALRRVASSGRYDMTVITPGTSVEEIIEILSDLSPRYKQTIIIGYPPFIKTVIDSAIEQKINIKDLKIKIGLGGEGHSIEWRNHILEKIGASKNDLAAISSAYGAADIGIAIGREYPITILIRNLANKDKDFAKELFGENSIIPSLYQYNSSAYIEAVDGELVFTANNGIPIVRYNIHDAGGVIDYQSMINITAAYGYDTTKILKNMGYRSDDIWRLPFFYTYGRSDGTISVIGANIYPENFQSALLSEETVAIHAFKLGIREDLTSVTRPELHIELNSDISDLTEAEQSDLVLKYHDLFINHLKKVNRDFKDAFRSDPKSCDIKVQIHHFGKGPFGHESAKIKRRYII